MRSIGLDCRSGIATAAIAFPVFLLSHFVLLIFDANSPALLFSAMILTALFPTITLAVLQCIWTKKTYVKRLHKTTMALEEISLGQTPDQLTRERYVLCSDIKQCPDDHTIEDCLSCEFYPAQNDLEKIGVIVKALGSNLTREHHQHNKTTTIETAEIIDLTQNGGFIRRDPGYDRTK